MSTQQAVHFGTQTPAAYSQRGARLIIMACRLDRCGTLRRPTDRDFHAAGGAFRHADARGLFTAWRSSYYNNGVSARSMRHLPPTDRDFHAAGGAFRHADARGLFTAGRSAYYNGVLSRSMRRLPPTDRDVHSAGGAFRHADARGGFRPANAARTLPHSSPTCDVQEANLFIQVSVKSISASCRRTHRPPLRAVGHRPAGTGAVCSSFLSAPRRRDSNGPFFSSSGSARSRRSARPPSGIVSVALPRPPLGGRSPRPSAAQFPESRLCGGLSASIHPLHPPIARAPRL